MSDLLSKDNVDPNQEAKEKLAKDLNQILEANKEPEDTTKSEAGTEANPSESAVSEEAPVVDEWEQEARQLGWKSKEERAEEGKDNRYFVEAREYVLRKPLFERIEQEKREAQEAKALAKQALDHLIALRKETYENQRRALESMEEKAVEESNTAEFRALKARQQQLQQQQAVDPIINQPVAPVIDPAVSDFETRNSSWYNDATVENRKMKAAAKAIDTYLVAQARIDQGLSENDIPKIDSRQHLAEIEKRIKQEFKSRFEPQQKASAAAVGKSTNSVAGVSKTNALASQLSERQLQMGRYFERTSKGQYTLEMYAKELQDLGQLGKQTTRG